MQSHWDVVCKKNLNKPKGIPYELNSLFYFIQLFNKNKYTSMHCPLLKHKNTILEKQIYHYAKKLIACYIVLWKNVNSSFHHF